MKTKTVKKPKKKINSKHFIIGFTYGENRELIAFKTKAKYIEFVLDYINNPLEYKFLSSITLSDLKIDE